MVVFAAAYYVTARIGLLQEIVRGQVTPLWPPTGIALVGLLLLGLWSWPAITIAAFLVNVVTGPTVWAALVISVGNTLAPVCAYLLLRKVGFRVDLVRLRDALALIFLGGFAAMLISATVGSGVLLVSGAIPRIGFWPTWSVWWTGDAMGIFLVAPLLLVLRKVRLPRGVPFWRWAEATVLVVGTFFAAQLAIRGPFDLLFLVFPFLIWAALRFQLGGAAPCAMIVSSVAIYAAAHATGPFSGHNLFADMVTLQAFNATTALTALVLAVITAERNNAEREIEEACKRLADTVSKLEQSRSIRDRLPSSLLDPTHSAKHGPHHHS